MSDTAIRVEKLSKQYKIGVSKQGHNTLRDHLAASLRSLLPSGDKTHHAEEATDTIWALKDVSFDVRQGEIIGIIGRNGAGKSTLLKILSRITVPTSGRAEVYGRVGSLLEVGTGFHPELTGRENIYLNGAVLGMTRSEIARHFDEIVDFSGVAKFLDTPIKHYSSGMKVRLAFSVAAHLEPDILLIDEVLAVGDAAFRKKCMGKMEHVTQSGRALLLVSHSMPAIENLCERVLWIDAGIILEEGEAKKVVGQYIDKVNQTLGGRTVGEYRNIGHRRGTGEVQFTTVRLINNAGLETREFMLGERILVEADFQAHRNVDHAIFGFGLVDAHNQVFITNWIGRREPQSLKTGDRGTFSIELSSSVLRARQYYVYLVVNDGTDVPFDVWDGVGTEFLVRSPADVESVDFWIGSDGALATLPIAAQIRRD